MRTTHGAARHWLFRLAALVCLAGLSTAASAQTSTAYYALDNIWLDPDISHPWEAPQQMTGAFQWTYTEGDFENGAGQFTDLFIPWYNPAIGVLNINIDLGSIEFTLPGNFHDLGVDVTLRLVEQLAPGQTSMIDTTLSLFEVQQGVSRQGHVISGSLVPTAAPCPADFTGDGAVDVSELVNLLAAWGSCPGCSEDITGDGIVDVLDLVVMLAAWGPCG